LDASFVTEVVILLAWALMTWYVYFTFRESGHAKAKTIALTLGVLDWSISAFGAAGNLSDSRAPQSKITFMVSMS